LVSASGSIVRENSALPTASRKRKVNKILLSSDDEEVVEEVTPPPKKKPAVAPAPTSRRRAVQSQSKQGTSSKVNAKRKKKKVSDDESSADEETAGSDSDFMDVDEDEKVKKKVVAKAKRSTKSTNGAGKGRVEGKSKEDLVKVEGEDKDTSNPKPKFKYESFPPSLSPFYKSLPFLGNKPEVSDSAFIFSWAAAKAARIAGPSNPGSKPVPSAAAPDCLAGLSFVFTGELSSFSREDAIDMAKRFCGCVHPNIIFLCLSTHTVSDVWLVNHPLKPTMSCSATMPV
jgi:replication factor C subunit 1